MALARCSTTCTAASTVCGITIPLHRPPTHLCSGAPIEHKTHSTDRFSVPDNGQATRLCCRRPPLTQPTSSSSTSLHTVRPSPSTSVAVGRSVIWLSARPCFGSRHVCVCVCLPVSVELCLSSISACPCLFVSMRLRLRTSVSSLTVSLTVTFLTSRTLSPPTRTHSHRDQRDPPRAQIQRPPFKRQCRHIGAGLRVRAQGMPEGCRGGGGRGWRGAGLSDASLSPRLRRALVRESHSRHRHRHH